MFDIELLLSEKSCADMHMLCKYYGLEYPCCNDGEYAYIRKKLMNAFQVTANYVNTPESLSMAIKHAKIFQAIDEEFHTNFPIVADEINKLSCELNDIIRAINGGDDWEITE